MSPAVWISCGALLLALITFVATQFGSKRTSTASYLTQLEGRVKHLEDELNAANLRIIQLERENVSLMRQLLGKSI